MALFLGRRRWRQTVTSFWRRFAVVVLVATVVVLAGIGVGVYALVHGFGPTVGAWTQLQTSGTLPAQESYFAVYDPQVDKVFRYFGGPLSGVPISTWALDCQTLTWSELPASGPAPTSEAVGLVYDETSGKITRLGVSLDSGDFDTWAYDASTNTWTDLRPTMPPRPRVGSLFGGDTMAYDARSGKVIFLAHIGLETITLAHDSRTNAWTRLTTNGSPPSRVQTAIAYDKSLGRLLLFGGWGHFEKADGDLFGDTWVFDSATSTWTELRPLKSPPARAEATMAYDDASGRMILFGGAGDDKSPVDTWSYDSAANTWTKLRTAGSPGPRVKPSMFYDSTSQRLVMSGGQLGYPGTPVLSDSWAFTWPSETLVPPSLHEQPRQ
jgi:hypothetical protein